jgi:ribonuclease III
VVGHILLRRFPNHAEGDLSRMRAGLVNEKELAGLARRLDLGAHIQLGRGETQTGGQAKNSILAGALEALMAAVFLDGGFDAARAIIEAHFEPLVDRLLTGSELADSRANSRNWCSRGPGACRATRSSAKTGRTTTRPSGWN